jgi:signal transduction histidine kinase/ActR/RegA family two-component response regulator
MSTLASISPELLARVRGDQVATLYSQWHSTTLSMVLGAGILCTVLWGHASPAVMALWVAAILVNQAWRGALARAFHRRAPAPEATGRWGRWWAVGSTLAGALWGAAAVAMYPRSPDYEALLIVCLFGAVLGGLNLTAVYKPSFYGFALCALLPLIARVAEEGDAVHVYIAIVMSVVLAFILGFGHHLNDVLTQSLAIRYANVDLIAELKAQTCAAEDARAAAETANRAKSQLLAAASHDLRQPLHALGLFAAALTARASQPELRALVASMQASVDALEGLFAQLLDLSRLEAGALSPEHATVALQSIFARLEADFAPPAAAHGLALAIVPTTAMVVSDAVLLERILRNYLANALRYTPAGGVVVGARRRAATVRIDVVDSGIGIAPALRERIFEEFVQGGTAPRPSATGRGMGLGLAIVRRLAVLLGHTIEVASTPGRGSRFSIAVPRDSGSRSRPACAGGEAGAAEPARCTPFACRRVAVVDDDPAVVAAMRTLFEAWGARVIAGATAAAVLAEAAADRREVPAEFDLIVADLRLGEGGCGLEAVAQILAAAPTAPAVLIVSGDTGEAARAAVAAAGFTLLAKPVVAATLQAAAIAALEQR